MSHHELDLPGLTIRTSGTTSAMVARVAQLRAAGYDPIVTAVGDNGHRQRLNVNTTPPEMRVVVRRTSKWS